MTESTEPIDPTETGELLDENAPRSTGSADGLIPPLAGCLYCHAEGAIRVSEGRRILGFGSGLPHLVCSNCASVALLEEDPTVPQRWRIRYKKVNRAPRYYYVMIYLGNAGWLEAEEALKISRNGFVQRHRLQQAQRGDLSWLRPEPLDPPPPLMSPDELVYLTANPATLQQTTRAGSVLPSDEQNVLDSGCLYVTDRKIHLLGHRRDWSHRLTEVQNVDHTERFWRVMVGATQQHYQGANLPDQIDAQLFTAVVKVLLKQEI
jgi:hypothetical protein